MTEWVNKNAVGAYFGAFAIVTITLTGLLTGFSIGYMISVIPIFLLIALMFAPFFWACVQLVRWTRWPRPVVEAISCGFAGAVAFYFFIGVSPRSDIDSALRDALFAPVGLAASGVAWLYWRLAGRPRPPYGREAKTPDA